MRLWKIQLGVCVLCVILLCDNLTEIVVLLSNRIWYHSPYETTRNVEKVPSNEPAPNPTADSQPVDNSKNVSAGIHSSNTNNYFRADGQNCGNILTERRSTKVQAAPGGGSLLGIYLVMAAASDVT
ncbi:Protein SPIRAL1-like 1 [Capsicum chinense]|nr:Protein SPIRAL1-like 1 [Capsicum chinense]